MNTIERLQAVVDYLGIGTTPLALQIGLKRTRIDSMIRKNVQSMPVDVAEAICRNFPTINQRWLLTGKGEMLNPTEPEPAPENADTLKFMKMLADLMEQHSQLMEQNSQLIDALMKSEKQKYEMSQKIDELITMQSLTMSLIRERNGDYRTPLMVSEPEADSSTLDP